MTKVAQMNNNDVISYLPSIISYDRRRQLKTTTGTKAKEGQKKEEGRKMKTGEE